MKRYELEHHGLRFEWAKLLLQHGVDPLEVAKKTDLEIEQIDLLVADLAAAKKEQVA